MKRLLFVLLAAACGGAARAPATPAPQQPAAPVVMKGPTATEYAPQLTAIGLDPANLQPLDKLPPEQLRKVMPLFAKSLGVKCTGCHDPKSEDTRTPNMNAAIAMWDHFVRGLTTKDGQPLFCDSCHHGAELVLDRRDTEKLAIWMDENFVSKLARKDKQEHACPTCHGEPAVMKFIPLWKAGKPFPHN